MGQHKISKLISSIQSFPTLPTIISEIMQITANPNSTVDELLRVIESDQALTTAILKLSNSAFFGRSGQIRSLQQALVFLGFNEIRNVVLAKAVFNSFKNIPDNGVLDIGKFWEHAFLSGLAARQIAKKLKHDGSDFFVAGLIHDVGKLAVYITLPLEFNRIVQTMNASASEMVTAEKEVLGITHDVVGMKLLERWFFPKDFISAVGFHHRPWEAINPTRYPTVVYIANLIAHLIQYEDGRQPGVDLIHKALFRKEIRKLASDQGIKWSKAAFEDLLIELEEIRASESDILPLFLT